MLRSLIGGRVNPGGTATQMQCARAVASVRNQAGVLERRPELTPGSSVEEITGVLMVKCSPNKTRGTTSQQWSDLPATGKRTICCKT